MGIDLALKRFELHARGKLLLLFKLHRRDLGGDELREAFSDRNLRFGDARSRWIVELQRAHDALADLQRHDDGRFDAARFGGKPYFFGRIEHARFAVFERFAGCFRAERADSMGQAIFPRPAITKNILGICDRHSRS